MIKKRRYPGKGVLVDDAQFSGTRLCKFVLVRVPDPVSVGDQEV